MSSKEESGGHADHRPAVAAPARDQLFPEPIFRSLYRLTGGVLRFFNVIWDGISSEEPSREGKGLIKKSP